MYSYLCIFHYLSFYVFPVFIKAYNIPLVREGNYLNDWFHSFQSDIPLRSEIAHYTLYKLSLKIRIFRLGKFVRWCTNIFPNEWRKAWLAWLRKTRSLNKKLLSKKGAALSKRYESFVGNNACNFAHCELLSIFFFRINIQIKNFEILVFL